MARVIYSTQRGMDRAGSKGRISKLTHEGSALHRALEDTGGVAASYSNNNSHYRSYVLQP